MLNKIVLASHNQGKLTELQQLLGTNFALHSLSEFTAQSAEETGLSFIENAILKARYAAKISGLPSLADDSGLMVDYLNGAPGIYSARFACDEPNFASNQDAANCAKLLRLLANVPKDQRMAQFVCVLALVKNEFDPLPLIFTGIWQGSILSKEIGTNGFGYDPLFFSFENNCSAAELSKDQKNQISHRAKAFAKLKQYISRDFYLL